MDPRHPELAIARIKELYNQFSRVLEDIKTASTSSRLGELEREASLVVQEICLVAPRLHEAMMQASRQRRHDIARGVLVEPQDTLVEMPHDWYLSVDEAIENPVEKYVAPNQAETVIVEPKSRKKTDKKKAKK